MCTSLKSFKLSLGILFTLIITVRLLAACSSEQNSQKTQNSTHSTIGASTNDSNTYYFVGEADYSPISFEQNGEAAELCPDIIREVFKRRMGCKVNVEDFRGAVEIAKTGEADVVSLVHISFQRERISTFPTEPLLIEKNILMVRKDFKIEFDGNIEKLKQYTFGILEGYATLDKYIAEGKITKLSKSRNNEEALKKLISGDHDIDIIVNTNHILLETANKMGNNGEVRKLATPLSVNPSYLAFTKQRDMTAIAAKFDVEIKKMKQDGSYDKIIEKYIGK